MQSVYVNGLLMDVANQEPDTEVDHTLMPRFTLELSGATMRVGGLAASWPQKRFYSEPLTAALPLFGNRRNAHEAARALDAMLKQLPHMAGAGPTQDPETAQQHSMWPGDLLQHFPPSQGYRIQSLPQSVPEQQDSLYLVSGGVRRQQVVKYFWSQGAAASMGAQQAWHGAGVAPEVVGAGAWYQGRHGRGVEVAMA